MAARRSRTRWPWLLAAAAVFLALVQLGNWQVQRLSWKRDLIARVDARIHADPATAPDQAQWPAVTRASHEYRRVSLRGRFLHEHEALAQATTGLGQGHWVMTPLRRDDGELVWINRGFVPAEARDPTRRGAPPPDGEVEITGLLRITEPGGGFLRDNDPAADRWHSRDVAALSASRGLPAGQVAPYFIDQEAAARAAPGVWPAAGLTVVSFRDNHLVYAITWYGLALGLLAAVGLAWRSERRRAGRGE